MTYRLRKRVLFDVGPRRCGKLHGCGQFLSPQGRVHRCRDRNGQGAGEHGEMVEGVQGRGCVSFHDNYGSYKPTKISEDVFAISIADKMTQGGKDDWFIPSAEEAKVLCASGLVACPHGIWTGNQKTTDAEFCPIGGASADSFPYDSTQGPNTYWYDAIRRF